MWRAWASRPAPPPTYERREKEDARSEQGALRCALERNAELGQQIKMEESSEINGKTHSA